MLLIVACCFGVASCCLFLWEIRAQKKRGELNEAVRFVTTPFSKGKIISESTAVGAAAVGMSLLDIYMSVENHSEVLDIIEQRYHRVLGADTSPWEWFEKLEELRSSGAESINNYLNAYVGQAGENATIEHFQSMGLKAELFESRVHPNDDLRVFFEDGNHIDYSVKSYEGIDNFESIVEQHPESYNYVINSELYDKLETTGKLAEYQEQGIEIVDGHFSHTEHLMEGNDAFGDIHEAGDLADSVPWISLAILGYRASKNFVQYLKDVQSGYELCINLTGDTVRIGSIGFGATVGCKAGALIGSIVTPGAGTIIGSVIGIVVGGITGSSIVKSSIEKIKWGTIIESLDYFGKRYLTGLTLSMKQNIKMKLLNASSIEQSYKKEQLLAAEYNDELDPYKLSVKPNLPAVLVHTSLIKHKACIEEINSTVERVESKIIELCETIGNKVAPEIKEEIKVRFLGELIAGNCDLLLSGDKTPENKKFITQYRLKLKKAPNHPYRFKMSPEDVLKQIVVESLNESLQEPDFSFRQPLFIVLLTIFCACFFVVLILIYGANR